MVSSCVFFFFNFIFSYLTDCPYKLFDFSFEFSYLFLSKTFRFTLSLFPRNSALTIFYCSFFSVAISPCQAVCTAL